MAAKPELQQIPGIGPSLQADLELLGVHRIADLEGRDPARMYLDLCSHSGYQDPCVLYCFRCAVYYAETQRRETALLDWWNWKNRVHANEAAANTEAAHKARIEATEARRAASTIARTAAVRRTEPVHGG